MKYASLSVISKFEFIQPYFYLYNNYKTYITNTNLKLYYKFKFKYQDINLVVENPFDNGLIFNRLFSNILVEG